MANAYARCKVCRNMWPSSPSGTVDHVHLSSEEAKRQLKLKHRVRKWGRSVPAAPRSNPPSGNKRSLVPRKRAYGPF